MGDQAPSLVVPEWVRPPGELPPGRPTVRVVCFVTTYSEASRKALADLARIGQQFTDAQIAAVAIWEPDLEASRAVLGSLDGPLALGLDRSDEASGRHDGPVSLAWMVAAGETGTPTAFVIARDGRIAWIGHPAQAGQVVEAVVRGGFDIEAEAAAFRSRRAREARLAKIQKRLAATGGPLDAVESGVLVEIEQAMADDPELARSLCNLRFYLLLSTREDEAAAYARTLAADSDHAQNPAALNILAWALIDPLARPAPGLAARQAALELATRAYQESRNSSPETLDTLAFARYLNGDQKGAIEAQEQAVARAVERAEASGRRPNPEFGRRLERYRREAPPRSADVLP